MIYSATHYSESAALRDIYRRQILWAILSLGVMVAGSGIPNKIFYALGYLIYGSSILSLFLTLVVGTRGRWIAMGSVRIQPSELAKIATVMALAKYLSGRKKVSPRQLVMPFIIVLVPLMAVAKQPDLGTALVFGVVLVPMLYWAGLKPLHLFFMFAPLLSILCAFRPVSWAVFIVILTIALYLSRPKVFKTAFLVTLNLGVGIATPALWGKLQEYQRQRILSFLDPSSDPLGAGYQIIQSKVAIGSGGFFGKGFLGGTQTKLAFLPRQHTDFIFSVIGEELGFLGAILVLSAFLFIIYRGIVIAASAKNRFASLLAIGLVSILAFHVFVNIGMTMGILPVTGLPLPFLSYGGSSLMTNMALVGLLVNVGMRRHEY